MRQNKIYTVVSVIKTTFIFKFFFKFFQITNKQREAAVNFIFFYVYVYHMLFQNQKLKIKVVFLVLSKLNQEKITNSNSTELIFVLFICFIIV